MPRHTPSPNPRGAIALITTVQYRSHHVAALRRFVYRNLYTLARLFSVQVTGGTYGCLREIIDGAPSTDECQLIEADTGLPCDDGAAVQRWRDVVTKGLVPRRADIQGMIEISYDLVEGVVGGVLHFVDWSDMNAKADTAVLWREANVHDIPIALDPDTAETFARSWRQQFDGSARSATLPTTSVESRRPLEDLELGQNVVALIAHDNKKLDICRFAVENSALLFDKYDWLLATGTTGKWLIEFMVAAGRTKKDVARIKRCNSGPYGGDVQIAHAVIGGLCRTVFFFQDPQVSHPHDADIRLFEQATVSVEPHALFATNAAAAKLLLAR